jgi:hypothetical protein
VYGKGFFDEYAKTGADLRDVHNNLDAFEPDQLAHRLQEAGIPGIKYLDRMSRAAGEGTRNYVVFNDKLIDIVKKYGLAGLLGSGMLATDRNQQ